MAETAPPDVLADFPYPKAMELYPTLRQSRLASFDACALEAKFDEEYRRGWGGHLAAGGQILHRVVAKMLEQMANTGEVTMDPEDGLAILRECLRQHDVEPRDVVNIPFQVIKDLRWVVVKFCHENVFDIQHLADTELRLRVPIAYENPKGGYVPRILTGQVDALFVPEPDWAVIPDWKFTWALPPANELSEGGYFQQRCYGFITMKRFPAIQRVTLRETYVKLKDEVTGGSPVREATVFRNELPEIEEEMSALCERWDRAVEHGTWPLPEDGSMPELWQPSPGSHCSYCPRPTACPIFPDARVEGAIENEEMAKTWAAQMVVAKAAQEQRAKALRAYAKAHGPVPIRNAKDPNRVVGYKASTRTSRPTQEELEQALEEQGADLDPRSLFKTQTQTRFTQHTHDPIEEQEVDRELEAALRESVAQAEAARQGGPDGNDGN